MSLSLGGGIVKDSLRLEPVITACTIERHFGICALKSLKWSSSVGSDPMLRLHFVVGDNFGVAAKCMSVMAQAGAWR